MPVLRGIAGLYLVLTNFMRQYPFMRFLRGPAVRTELSDTFRLALPLMLGELSSMLMGVAGTMMAGRLGEESLAAAGVASVVFVMSMLLVWGSVRMIPTPVAEYHELRNGEKVRTLLGGGLLMGLGLTIVGAGLLQIGIHNFHLLKQDPGVSVLAVEYLQIIAWSMPALILFALLVSVVDAFEYVKLTMYLSFFGLLLDVSLNWVFIFGNWGMPRMGVRAIAMSTGITHAVMVFVLILVLWKKKELAYFRVARTTWPALLAQTIQFFKTGIPSAFQIMVEFAAFAAGTIIVGQISKTEQAAHQIAINLISVTYVTIMGVSTAGMIRIGQALAYNSRIRIWMAGVSTILLAMVIMAFPAMAFLSIPESIVRLYTDEEPVVAIAIGLLLLAGLFQLADAAQASCISLLRALNDVNVPSLLSFIAFWLIGVPLGYWLAVPMGWNAKGVWVGYLVALVIQAAFFMARFFQLTRKFG